MARIFADRIAETTITTGTGTYNLDGALTGFQSFVQGVGDTNTCFYCVTDDIDWEIVEGLVTDAAPDTLTRATILASSNADAAVVWGSGVKTIFGINPAQNMTPATKAQQEAGTTFDAFVTPGQQHSHPSAVKFWCKFDGTSVDPITAAVDYNVTDITKTATGDFTINIDTDFSGVDYAPFAFVNDSGSARNCFVVQDATSSPAAGTLRINIPATSNQSLQNCSAIWAMGLGDQ